jgi:hypothetical protein
MQQELYDSLKVWDVTLMTQIDIQVAELCLEDLRLQIKIQEGQEPSYEGRQYVEDEQVLGSSDKMIFYAKEMISDLTIKPKEELNPFIIAKLDLNSIKYFDFPKIPAEMNKY